MATSPKRQVGTIGCLCCGHEIPVKVAENGTLNAACAWCDFPAYAKAGTQAHAIISGRLKNQPALAPAPAEKPKASAPAPAQKAPEPTPTPAPRKARSIFDLGVAA